MKSKIIFSFLIFLFLLGGCSAPEQASPNSANSLQDSSPTNEISSSTSSCPNQQYTSMEIADAVGVVSTYLKAKKANNCDLYYTTLWQSEPQTSSHETCDFGVISLDITTIEFDATETTRIIDNYADNEIAENDMIAIFAAYTVDYDNTKVPHNEGNITQFFYLVREDANDNWLIWDQGRIASN